MPAGERLADYIRKRCLYTGESFRYLKGSLEAVGGEYPIPAAAEDQAVLESQVLAYLANGSEWWAHPVGISRVRIAAGGDVVVHLDGHTEPRSPLVLFAIS